MSAIDKQDRKCTFVRIRKHEYKILQGMKMGEESNSQVLARLLSEYDSKGYQRAIGFHITELQSVVKDVLPLDYISGLEMLKAHLIMAMRERSEPLRISQARAFTKVMNVFVDGLPQKLLTEPQIQQQR